MGSFVKLQVGCIFHFLNSDDDHLSVMLLAHRLWHKYWKKKAKFHDDEQILSDVPSPAKFKKWEHSGSKSSTDTSIEISHRMNFSVWGEKNAWFFTWPEFPKERFSDEIHFYISGLQIVFFNNRYTASPSLQKHQTKILPNLYNPISRKTAFYIEK